MKRGEVAVNAMIRDRADRMKFAKEDLAGKLIRAFLFLVAFSMPAAGQQPSEEELAKQSQNPVADLVSVPLQSNFNFGAGIHHNKMIYLLNVQPVIPIKLSEEWNLIARIIMPIINQPNLSASFGGVVPSTTGTGLGDFNPTFFFSPAKPGQLIWGLGPPSLWQPATERSTYGPTMKMVVSCGEI